MDEEQQAGIDYEAFVVYLVGASATPALPGKLPAGPALALTRCANGAACLPIFGTVCRRRAGPMNSGYIAKGAKGAQSTDSRANGSTGGAKAVSPAPRSSTNQTPSQSVVIQGSVIGKPWPSLGSPDGGCADCATCDPGYSMCAIA